MTVVEYHRRTKGLNEFFDAFKGDRTMKTEVFLSIHYIDGTLLKLKWDENDDDPSKMIARVRKALEMDRFYFEADETLMIIPMQNIKYLSFSPLPAALPKDLVIRNASIVC
jgi:hypothetical protein